NTTDTSRLRTTLSEERAALLDRLVDLTTEQQRVFTSDYSPWDEMVEFVRNPDPEWGRINLDAAIETHHVDAVWVLRPDLNEVHGAARGDAKQLRTLFLTPEALRHLTAPTAEFHCFVATESGLMEIRGAPIRPSDRSLAIPSPHGWLLSGRLWDTHYLEQLQALLGGTVRLAENVQPSSDPDEIVSTRPLPDWQGRTLRTLQSSFRAPSLVRARADARTDLLFLCGFGVAALCAFGIATHFWVARPLGQLTLSLAQRDPAPLAGLLRAGGEFGTLGRIVNESFRHEQKLQQIYAAFNAIDDAVFITDPVSDHILHVNVGATRLLGYPDKALLGRTLASLRAAPPAATPEGTWLQCQDGRAVEVEARAHSLPAQTAPDRLSVTIARDISDRRRMEEQRLRAQRMESLGTLAGGVAHDMNNMLTPVILMLDELQDLGTRPNPTLLASVRSSVRRSATMLRQLLAFGRGFEGERVPLSIAKIVEELGRIVDSTFPKSISFTTDVARHLPPVLGDATQLHQVLLNLSVNARDAMPDGGLIRVVAQRTVLDEANRSEWPEAKPGSYVQVDVTDNGCGMPPTILHRIFDPYFTTKPVDKGTGLGLSTTLGIIRGHGGVIRVRSELGRGTTFSILLPEGAVAAPTGESEIRPETYRSAQLQTVLIIEDEDSIRDTLRRTFMRMGMTPLLAHDGREGVALFHRHRTEITLVITDFQMPGMDGLAVLREIRIAAPLLPVLVMSGRIDDSAQEQLRQTGASGFIDKPFGYDQIQQAVAGVLV
ncbi:MAG TPA: ATP-binding protein, partial [Lacunisphaera sp.]|nr:ATP-binding protein [Lacunisphaera sp.]